MALSSDPAARQRQLSNLVPGAGGGARDKPPNLKHGAYTENPGEAELAPIREQMESDPTLIGELEHALAIDMLIVDRLARFLATNGFEQRKRTGREPKLRPEVAMLSQANERRVRRADALRRLRAGKDGGGKGGDDLAALLAGNGDGEAGPE